MKSLKEFLEQNKSEITEFWDSAYPNEPTGKYTISLERLGMFFWNRGGKRFFEDFEAYESANYVGTKHPSVAQLKRIAKQHDDESDARDFLDCLDCLGSEKVKELIKKLVE